MNVTPPIDTGGDHMTRVELLEAASNKLTEAAILLLVAGEGHLATEIEDIKERVDFDNHIQPLEAPKISSTTIL
jgi:hypothetical protein